MIKIIKKIKFSPIYIYYISFFLIGIFLISNSLIRISLFEDVFHSNQKIEKPNEADFSHKNHYENYSNKILTSDELESVPLLTLPKDLYLIGDIQIKKEKFINTLLPLIIAENQKILSYRYQIKIIQKSLNLNKTLSNSEQIFIEKIASRYLVKFKNRHKVDIINDLLNLVDIIPNSIVLAQAANESGWGSSRFAREFNALFGQYTYDNNSGVKPSYREEGKKHLIKFFPSINHSIKSYFNNINTHSAYYDFRETRKHLRENDLFLDPGILVKKLGGYAKDKHYVDTIISIIKVNKLNQYDNLKTI